MEGAADHNAQLLKQYAGRLKWIS